MSLLEIRNLTVTFPTARGPLLAVEGLDLDVGEGEVMGIVGELGSGKSVAMLAVMGLIRRPVSPPQTCCASTVSICFACRHALAVDWSARTWR